MNKDEINLVRPRIDNVDPKTIIPIEPFVSLFHIDQERLDALTEEMKRNKRFDEEHPLVVWPERKALISGHTRRLAAIAAKITVSVREKSFPDDDAALLYAVNEERLRRGRGLEDPEILRVLGVVYKPKVRGGCHAKADTGTKTPNAATAQEKYSKEIGRKYCIAPRKVERGWRVLQSGDQQLIGEVSSGKLSIYRADAMLAARTREEPGAGKEPSEEASGKKQETKVVVENATGNVEAVISTNNTAGAGGRATSVTENTSGKYAFAAWVWRLDLSAPLPSGDLPFVPPTKKPPEDKASPKDRILIESDPFHSNVPVGWVDKILGAIKEAKEWTFISVSDHPDRSRIAAVENWPENYWLGAFTGTNHAARAAERAFSTLRSNVVTFACCEPLQEEIKYLDFRASFDWLVIGAESREHQPEWKWVFRLLKWADGMFDCPVYFEPGLLVRPKKGPPKLGGSLASQIREYERHVRDGEREKAQQRMMDKKKSQKKSP
ncbi:MAG: DUF5131 family protein [Syntrophorhabdales bacterium]